MDRQALGRGHGNGIAGVDAGGVHVFDGADDQGLAGAIAQDFQFDLLPGQQRGFDGYGAAAFPGRRSGKLTEFILVVYQHTVRYQVGVGAPQDHRKSEFLGLLGCCRRILEDGNRGRRKADLIQGGVQGVPVQKMLQRLNG
jgi:hypothetical protein